MRKILTLSLVLIMAMALGGCDGFNAHDQEVIDKEQQTGGMPNLFSKVENSRVFNEKIGINIDAPSSATNIEYSMYSNEIARIDYDIDGKSFVLRASKTISGQELSGIDGDFEEEAIGQEVDGDNFSYSIYVVIVKDNGCLATSTINILDDDTVYLSLHSADSNYDMEDMLTLISSISSNYVESINAEQ